MILRGLRLRNYRAFVREVSVVFRPLTLLFGYNSAGKSALLRALPLIAESIRSSSGPLAEGGRAAKGSRFRDMRTRWSAGDRMSFGLDWDDGDQALDVEIVEHASMQRQAIDTFRMRDATRGELRFDLDIADERATDLTTYALGEARGRIRFEGWRPFGIEGFAAGDIERIEEVGKRLERLADSTQWLGALRFQPQRYLPLAGSTSRIADNGAGTIEVLARESLLPDSEILTEVSRWFEGATEHTLRVGQQVVASDPVFHVELRPLRAPLGIHIADTGEGMTQVLPVITLGALAMKGRLGEAPILAIEQPELHLHPRAHRYVAEHLIAAARKATVVVETHSENFLLAVQLAIANGQIGPEDVIVHWVRGTQEGPSFVEAITFDDKARPSAWPHGVFAEDRELARHLIEWQHGLGTS